MNETLRNPLVLFLAMLLALWLAVKLLKIALSLWWLIAVVLIVAFIVDPRFRSRVQRFFNSIFN